jgi:mannosyltransferase OCH1-like enzyme
LRKYFFKIGGYDESLEPMGYEDKDLFERLKASGLLYIVASDHRYNLAIANSKVEGLVNTGSNSSVLDMMRKNENKSKQNIEKGSFVANDGIFGIRKNLYDHQENAHKINLDTFSIFSQVKFPTNKFEICYSDGSIPKFIHQVWGGEHPLPDNYSLLSERWKQHYPQWQYKLWDDRRMCTFIENYYPQYMEMYCSFPYHIQRWDAIRYLILYKMGGMYIDFDYESLEPIDELVKDKTCCFAMEPESHCRIFGKSMMLNNAMMLSIPAHPFMQKVIETVFSKKWQQSVTAAAAYFSDEYCRKNHIVLHSTGPWMLMELYHQLSESEKKDVYLIPDKYVTPFDVDQAGMVVRGADNEELEGCLAEAYAVHYFIGLWKNAEK